jgi:NitT/TauT family transport system permease protein
MALDMYETALSHHDAEIAGLDALDIPIAAAKGRMARVWEGLWPKLAALALFFLGWQAIVWTGWKPEFALPGPVAALKALWHAAWDSTPNGSHILVHATANTMKRAAVGYAISVVIGVAIGLAGLRSAR